MLLLVCLVVFVIYIYVKLIRPHNYWSNKGVKFVKPWPVLGSFASSILRVKSMTETTQDIYNAYPEERYYGFYQTVLPAFMVRDPELIKRITVKDFDAFPEHRPIFSEDSDPLWQKNLFAMRGGDRWRSMRSTLSPAFTSGKMRAMFQFMNDCAKQATAHFLSKSTGDTVEIELKDTFSRYTNDVIASTAFGVTCDSLENRDNEFFLMGREATNFNALRMLRVVVYNISPTLAKLFKITMFGEAVSKFFRNIVGEAVRYREENCIVRPDMIHLLMEAKKGKLKHDDNHHSIADSGFAIVQESEIENKEKHGKPEVTDDDMVAQALIFFVAGFDTASTAMSHTVFELAINVDVQVKLRQEIDDTLEQCAGEITYEGLLGMKYLDMVISESLRKWPPAAFTDRHSTKPVVIEPKLASEKPVYLETGTLIMLPIFAIHRDPKYYPDPLKFDPERFSDANKDQIQPYTYLPFGSGPRNCIGSRFALLEVKIVIFQFLTKFEVVPVSKTQIPLVLSKSMITPVAENGFWVGLKPRNKTAL